MSANVQLSAEGRQQGSHCTQHSAWMLLAHFQALAWLASSAATQQPCAGVLPEDLLQCLPGG